MSKLFSRSRSVIAATMFFLGGFGAADAETLRAPGGGTVRALVLGVNEYPRLGPGAQLHGATADAQDIAAALAKDDVKVNLILNGAATRARIVDAMNDLVEVAQPGDLVFISYAGHGMQTPEYPRWKGVSMNGANEQIALSDFSYSGPGAGEIVVNMEMLAWLSRLNAKGVDTLLVLDANFDGGKCGCGTEVGPGPWRRALPGTADIADREKFLGIPMTDNEARAHTAAMQHVTFLGGATTKSAVPEMPGLDSRNPSVPRGALSYYVARALEGGASIDGMVTRKSLFQFVLQNVRQATNGRQAVDVEPRSADTEVLEKPVFAITDVPLPKPKPTENP